MIDLNKYIRYIKKYILIVVLGHTINWFFIERQGIGRPEAGFFDNLLWNLFIITITIAMMESWIPKIISRFSNFIRSRKE